MTVKYTPARRLHREFDDAVNGGKIGGASVLGKLSTLANNCISGISHSQDAVAFAVFIIFALHAENREERIVTGDDTYLLMGSGYDCLNDAILYIERGGTADEAVRIIASLIPIIPNTLYGHSA